MDIKVLDNLTINKIAAGEVIENPASVVKELVENSIDASAKNVLIEIVGGGLELIKVADDGEGIDRENIQRAFREHATSKLENIEDLESISSFGFRGEALPSIAAVSKVEIVTKNKKEKSTYGCRYTISNGAGSEIEDVAANDGTIISVRELFYNVPVRKKFLKDKSRESAYISELVLRFALANLEVAFTLIIDGKRKFSTSGNGDIKAILYETYGRQVYDNIIEIDDIYDGIRLKGAIARPNVARNSRNDEIYFVNKRYIKNKTISNAIENAYEPYLMQHKYPLVVISIAIDSRLVDVNVHPKKLEVKFSDEGKIYFSVYEIISNALKKVDLIHEENFDDEEKSDAIALQDLQVNSFDEAVSSDDIRDFNHSESESIIKQVDAKSVDELPTLASIFNKEVESGLPLDSFNKKFDTVESSEKTTKSMYERPFVTATLSEDHKYIGQVFETYILVEFDNKLYILDQHAAHEKINFERIMKQYKNGKVDSQKIFPSIVLRLTPHEYSAVEKNISEFESVGYEISTFGDRDIKVDAVPYNIFDIGAKELLLDMIASFADDKNKEVYTCIAEKIASISCKKAIKANHRLSEDEVKELLRELFKLDNPYNCPHGRPTIISLSKQEFEKKFGRIV